MGKKLLLDTMAILLAGCLAGTVLASSAPAQQERKATDVTPTKKTSPYRTVSITERAKTYYQTIWGIDNLLVRHTASGNLIRFSYRVVDPARATVLGDSRATPHLIAPSRGVVLQVPSMEQIGELRQKSKLVAGKEYWMVFSNKGNPVRAGDRVNVVIGSFQANGLRVE